MLDRLAAVTEMPVCVCLCVHTWGTLWQKHLGRETLSLRTLIWAVAPFLSVEVIPVKLLPTACQSVSPALGGVSMGFI